MHKLGTGKQAEKVLDAENIAGGLLRPPFLSLEPLMSAENAVRQSRERPVHDFRAETVPAHGLTPLLRKLVMPAHKPGCEVAFWPTGNSTVSVEHHAQYRRAGTPLTTNEDRRQYVNGKRYISAHRIIQSGLHRGIRGGGLCPSRLIPKLVHPYTSGRLDILEIRRLKLAAPSLYGRGEQWTVRV
jgi:hypothetical protein